MIAVDMCRGRAARHRRRGCSAVGGGDRGGVGHLCREGDLVCLSGTTSQGQIGLLEISYVELKRVDVAVFDRVVHEVDNGLRRDVFFTPDSGGHGTALAIDGDNVELVTPRSLNRRDVKAK
jgi:hypothetical protein